MADGDRWRSFTNDEIERSRFLVKALEANDFMWFRKILCSGADPNRILVPEGYSAMHFFLGPQMKDVLTCADLLLRYGGNPNVKSSDGLTPVHVSAAWGRADVLKLLLKYGGDPNVRDDDGNCPLRLAQENGHYDVIEVLEQHFNSLYLSKYVKLFAIDSEGDSVACCSDQTLASDTFKSETSSKLVNSRLNLALLSADLENLTLEKQMNEVCSITNEHSSYFTADVDETDSWCTVDEYLFVDSKEQVAFIERKWLPDSFGETSSNCSAELYNCAHIVDKTVESELSEASSVPASLKTLADQVVLQRLKTYGDVPGPITASTRRVYLRRLNKLRKGISNSCEASSQKKLPHKTYSPQLNALISAKCVFDSYSKLEDAFLVEYIDPKAGISLRGGAIKSCFNYLLLDSRVTNNLPQRAKALAEAEVLKDFVSAIFYVGKGQQSRTYDHLYEAIRTESQLSRKVSNKVKCILDIWNGGFGVISLHCFQGTIAAEAFTREACIIDAIGIMNLANEKVGSYYGQVAHWPRKDKCKLGSVFLKRALAIFLQEGERQIHSINVAKQNVV